MLKDLENVDEIEDFFKNLNEKGEGIAKINRARLYGMAYEYQQLSLKEKPLRERFEDKRYYAVEGVLIINEDYQFVKTKRNDTGEILYHIFVNYKPINECAYSLDSALLSAIAHKNTGNTQSAMYMGKLINLKDIPQFE